MCNDSPKFIVFEGLDGAGTTTQLHLLEKNLIDSGRENVFVTAEPTDNPIGKLIRSALRKEFTLEPKTLAMLYAADRNEHLYGTDGVFEHLQNSDIVLCDRYLYSSIAYQSITCGMEYIKDLNDQFLKPDIVFYINTPVDECIKRIESRNQGVELFEKAEYLSKVKENYDYIMLALKTEQCLDGNPLIVEIDGTQSREQIADQVFSIVQKLLK